MSRQAGRRKCRGEAGETLAEVLVTLSILSLAVVVLVAALATTIKASASHRQRTTADTIARNVAEALKNPDVYVPCATSYAVPPSLDKPGYVVTQEITFWDGAAPVDADTGSGFGLTCDPESDKGLQRIKITVTTVPAAESDSMTILKRRG